MKTNIPSVILASLLSVLMLSSSCKNKAGENISTDEVLVVDTAQTDIDSVNRQQDNRLDTVAVNQTEPANAKSKKKTEHTSHKSLEGYSAPDGTDAENHDGDQYTKNDQRLMPSGGTSIK